ncbi:DEAD/DEAH box helicase [Dermabacteraceae bacterium P13138]
MSESAAEKYARYRARAKSPWQRFVSRFLFLPDPFQEKACRAIEDGSSVLVAAPTGAGKTLVGEYAIFLASENGGKVFYTTPIKALSNQKYRELCEWLGEDRVGLLTGDVSRNGEADVVVMTTEVLRNMLYADSATLDELSYVVMDEVHYLADRFRGPVWEEVILHLPEQVKLVALSATVSNAEEFGDWLNEVRGTTRVIVSENRPVPLWQHVLIGRELVDVFVDADGEPVASHGPDRSTKPLVNPDLEFNPDFLRTPRRARGHGQRGRGRPRITGGVTGRPEAIMALDDAGLLPAIFFIFSRKGCEAALSRCAQMRLSLTTRQEQQLIAEHVDRRTATLSESDRDALRLWAFRSSAIHGLACHHAGMLPLLKEIVEELFSEGLIKVVFATETLALGINMPARSVVLDKLSKYNGIGHVDLTPGEYTQLTGRAGRRGIDTEGHAVVVAGGDIAPTAVAQLASRRTFPLRSAFRPTYNMSVNLLGRLTPSESREILESSFAQFQADRSVVGLARKARDLGTTADSYAEAMSCERGDYREYSRLLEEIADREKALSRERSLKQSKLLHDSVARLKPGQLVAVGAGKRAGCYLVLGRHNNALKLLSVKGQLRTMGPTEFATAPAVVGQISLPRSVDVSTGRARKDLAARCRAKLDPGLDPAKAVRKAHKQVPSSAASDPLLQELREKLRAHPCHDCPDKESHLRWQRRYLKTKREQEKIIRTIDGRTSSIGKSFTRVCELLAERGYVAGEGEDLAPTEAGRLLQRIYSERDLLLAETLRGGVWDKLTAPEVVAFAACMSADSRREDHAPSAPTAGVSAAYRSALNLWSKLERDERQRHLETTPEPTLAVAVTMFRWAKGSDLALALEGSDLTAGDFVRQCRQIVDLLQQLRAFEPLRARCDAGIKLVRRGIVAQELEAPAL